MVMKKLEENVQRMDVLAGNIIDVSNQQAESANGHLKYRSSNHRRLVHDKNGFVSELMTIITDCRKMNLNQVDKATLDMTITRLNKKLYAATSMTIL
jgi:hypothetical protein